MYTFGFKTVLFPVQTFILFGLCVTGLCWKSSSAAEMQEGAGLHVRKSASAALSGTSAPSAPALPVISSTYLGGAGFEIAWMCAVDKNGNVYIGGDAQPAIGQSVADCPVTANAVQKTYGGGGQDGCVAKYDRNGQLLWSTYLGGTNWDGVFGLTTDAAGNVVVTGVTASNDFPTTNNAVQRTIASGADVAFVTVISADGTQILYSTFLGGTVGDSAPPLPVNIGHLIPQDGVYTIGIGVAVGNDGTVYVVGGTNTIDMPVSSGAAQLTIGGEEDGFVARIDPTKSGTAGLVYCTYLGGVLSDFCSAVVVDQSDNAFVTGEAQSQNFPTTLGAYQRVHAPGTAAFITKLNPTGTAMIYSTQLSGSQGSSAVGGTNYTAGSTIAIDSLGQAYIDGETNATDFPTTAGVVQPASSGKNDGFVSEISADGTALVFSTYLGGSDNDGLFGLALDSHGNIFVGGYTASRDILKVRAFQPNYILDTEGWVAELSPGGTSLLFSSYLAGSDQDSIYGLALWNDELYLAGRTASTNFPITPTAQQKTYGGGVWDIFLTQVNLNPVLQIAAVNRLANGDFVIGVQAGALTSVEIQVSSDLFGSFTPIGSITTDFTGAFELEDANAAALPKRFYRASYR
jgi:hypothetical protein